MACVIGVEIGARRIVAAIAEPDAPPRVVLGADGSFLSSASGAGRWKWSIHQSSLSQRLATARLSELHRALLDHAVGAAEMTVLAVSPGYGDERTAALVETMVSVGFPSLRIIDEGVALSLGVGRSWLRSPGIVLDLGAEHAAATLVGLGADRSDRLASEGDEFTSLDSVALQLRDELVAQVERAAKLSITLANRELLLEELRTSLSAYRGGPLRVRSDAPGGGSPWDLVVPESAMQFLRGELVEGIARLADAVMARGRVRPESVTRAWFTGPASTDDALRAAIRARLPCELRPVPAELIACGAARFGMELLGASTHTPLPRFMASSPPAAPIIGEVVEVMRASQPPPEPAPSMLTVDAPTVASSIEEPLGRPTTASEVSRLRVTGPPASAHQLPRAGTFRGARTPVELLGMPLMRSPTEHELSEPYLPVLMLQLATAQVSGSLSIQRGGESARFYFSRGGICVAPLDRNRMQRVFEWSDGSFAWRDELPPAPVAKQRTPTFGFVAAGLRAALRGMPDAAVLAAFGPRLALSPVVIPERRRRALAMDFGPAEQRAIDHMLDGKRDVMGLLAEGYIGRLTFMRVLLLLEAFGALRWVPAAVDHGETPVDRLKRRLAHMEHEDHFTALGLHWTATHDDVQEAWAEFQAQCAPDGRVGAVDREVAAAILARGRVAWELLRDDQRRVKYRHELHPDVDETMLATIVAAQAELLAYRGELKVAQAMRGLAAEMVGSPPPPPRKDK